jgi:hypothetical protein
MSRGAALSDERDAESLFGRRGAELGLNDWRVYVRSVVPHADESL